MKAIIILFLLGLVVHAQDIRVSSGKIERIEKFNSKLIDSRTIDVWLPENYTANKKYAVLYMHDGQMLFDSTQTWNKQSWKIDKIATKLILEKTIIDFIVVGIWNNGQKRHEEFFPQKPYESLSKIQKDSITIQLQKKGRATASFKPNSDLYLKFIIHELKPFIDQTFSTKSERKSTFIAGSSMGGLISIYAICEYPKVFGGAACLSTHWTGTFKVENNPIPEAFANYLMKKLPSPNSHKIYFDCGDQTLDALYPNIQKQIDQIMIKKGFTNQNWMTKFFPGKDHSEKSWQERLPIPLEFLFKENTSSD